MRSRNSDHSPQTQCERLKLKGLPWWVHAVALGLCALATLAVGLVYWKWGHVDVWRTFEPSGELHKPLYFETTHVESVFRTRANTWSNLAFAYVGFYVIAIGLADIGQRRSRSRGHLASTPGLSIFFGLACCFLGFSSGLFHASMTRWGQQMDVVSMYVPLLALIAAGLSRWIPRLPNPRSEGGMPSWPIAVALATAVSVYLYVYKWEMSSTNVMATLMGALVLIAAADRLFTRTRFQLRWFLAAGAAFVLAYICRDLDIRGRFSGPDDWWQGHSAWHLLCAFSLWFAYLFYRSEDAREPDGTQQGESS